MRARIPVRGLDRDPDLGKRVVASLEQHPGVRATVNQLTGRVLGRIHQTPSGHR